MENKKTILNILQYKSSINNGLSSLVNNNNISSKLNFRI